MEPLPQHQNEPGPSNPYTGARGCQELGVQFPVGTQTRTPVTEGASG